jgi:cell division protein FtsB
MWPATLGAPPFTTCVDLGEVFFMRYITFALLGLLALVHLELWFGKGGVPRMMELQSKLALQKTTNLGHTARNRQLLAEVRDLKEGLEMVEENARFDLGMVKPNEILVQLSATQTATVLPSAVSATNSKPAASAHRPASKP